MPTRRLPRQPNLEQLRKQAKDLLQQANIYASGGPLRNAYQDEALKQLLLERGAKQQPYLIKETGEVDEARRMLEADTGEELSREFTWSAASNGFPAILGLSPQRLNWPAHDPRWPDILIQPMRGVDDDDRDHEPFIACLAILLRRGIDVNLSEPERTRFASLLLDHGAGLDRRDDLLKSTPLGWACRRGRQELVELLIARGAPVDDRTPNRGPRRCRGPARWATPPSPPFCAAAGPLDATRPVAPAPPAAARRVPAACPEQRAPRRAGRPSGMRPRMPRIWLQS